jgi:hypothetical protein
MADFMNKLEDIFHSINTKVARYASNREIVDETGSITDPFRLKS